MHIICIYYNCKMWSRLLTYILFFLLSHAFGEKGLKFDGSLTLDR